MPVDAAVGVEAGDSVGVPLAAAVIGVPLEAVAEKAVDFVVVAAAVVVVAAAMSVDSAVEVAAGSGDDRLVARDEPSPQLAGTAYGKAWKVCFHTFRLLSLPL